MTVRPNQTLAPTETREVSPSEPSTMVGVQSARAIAEVQGSMAIAKRFPRDETQAYARIMKACSRKSLAEVAVYEYPRGGEKVRGPSIRLAEAIAQCWGNLASGVVELDRREGESLAMAYCVDLETNYRKDVTFSVPHVRDTKQGSKALTDSRDIYETVMNMGSRRLRNCLMAVIPGDIFDAAEAKCAETLSSDQVPLQDRIREMLAAFAEHGVSSDQIAKRFGCRVEALSPQQLVKLRGIYQSLRDGVGAVSDFFDVAPAEGSRTDRMNQEAAARAAAPQAPKSEPKPAAPTAFEASTGSLFEPNKAEGLPELQTEVAGLKTRIGYSNEQFLGHVNEMFGDLPQNLSIHQVRKLRDRYRADLAQMLVK